MERLFDRKEAMMRIGLSLLLALLINGLLFTLMQQMVASREVNLNQADAVLIDFIRIPDQSDIAPERRMRKPPPEPPEPSDQPARQVQPVQVAITPPPPMPLPALKIDTPLMTAIEMDAPYMGPVLANAPVNSGLDFVMAHELSPILATLPRYPMSLKRRGIEGYVEVEYTVTERGMVKNPVILKSVPHAGFGRSTARTIKGWKFHPYRKDGKPVATRVRQRIDFSLE